MSFGGLAGLLEGFRGSLREIQTGKIPPPTACAAPVTRHGAYGLLGGPSVPELWQALLAAAAGGFPLAILPPASAVERELLLRQLPANPDPATRLVLFTSGTTGAPKAVLHSESSLLASARQLAAANPGNGATCSLLAPWGMAGLVFHVLLPAARGTDVLFGSGTFFDWAPNAPSLLAAANVELLTLNPALLELFLLSQPGQRFRGTIYSLTAPLKPALRERAKGECAAELREIYGMTEAAGPVLLDGESLGAETRLSATGELELRGPQLFLGYGSEGGFQPRAEWFATGDAFESQNGRWAHRARLRDCIDVGGRKIAPRLIEETMERMPELRECLAFAVTLAGEERPGLLSGRRDGATGTRAELEHAVGRWLESTLSPEVRPRWWRETETLPRGKNGKPDRKAAGLLVPKG